MDILIIGGGGREHAIAAKIMEQNPGVTIHAAPGNAGIAAMGGKCYFDLREDYLERIVELAEDIKADRVIVTPDGPLVAGTVDRLAEEGFRTFGPNKKAAII